MADCLCGNPAAGNGVRCLRCAALQEIGLHADATENDIKAAYRLLVKVWHPDRFPGDRVLQEAAEAKLKDINSAYAFLASESAGQARRAKPEPNDFATRKPSTKKAATAEPAETKWAAPVGRQSGNSSAVAFSALKIFLKTLLIAIAILMGRYLWIAADVQNSTSEGMEEVYGQGKDRLSRELDAPRRRLIAAVEQDLERFGFRDPAPAPVTLLQPAELASAAPAKAATEAVEPTERPWTAPRQAPRSRAELSKVYPYITVGSTIEEVLDQVGTPTQSTANKLVFGNSELYFKNGSVTGWRIDPVSSPIRVKLWPESSVDTSLRSFTVGSTRDVVLVVQGTPTAFSEDVFEYGASEVYFNNNRVTHWKNDPASIPLRARMP